MPEISAGDWDALQGLAGRVGLPDERISLLRRRLEAAPGERPGSPYVLLAGRPDAGIEVLLARWIAPEPAEELKKLGERPLVLGPTPAEVRPRIGTWATWKGPAHHSGHLIALRTAGKPPADVLAQFATLGVIDELVLVTRLGQPLHAHERDLARALAGVVATVRVLIVGLPGEEPTDTDLAEVTAFAVSQMRQAGFTDGRCLGAGVWFTGGAVQPGTVAEVSTFLAVAPDAVNAGRSGMTRSGLGDLFVELRRRAVTTPEAALAVPDAERERLTGELAGYLADLGRELLRLGEKRPGQTTASLRTHALDALRGWGAHVSIEGHWLKYVENLRPGTQAALLTEAEAALALVEFQPGTPPADAGPIGSLPVVETVLLEAKRLAVGLGLGIAASFGVNALLTGPGANVFPGLLVPPLTWLTLGLGVVLGYGIGRSFFRAGGDRREASKPEPPELHGWTQVERRLAAWFSERFRARPASALEECRSLAARFGIPEVES